MLDTEVYSNTGGQASKATPRGAVAKFAVGGKPGAKKDLGMIAMSYGKVFVGQIALVRQSASRHQDDPRGRGVSRQLADHCLLHCIGWGIDMEQGLQHQKEGVACGYWPLYHYDPEDKGQSFHLDGRKPSGTFKDFAMKEARFAMLARSKPQDSERLLVEGQHDIQARWAFYEQLAGAAQAIHGNGGNQGSTSKEVES